MKGDIAFAGLLLTADEWAVLDPETRDALLDVAMRRFPTGTEPPYGAAASPEPAALPAAPVAGLADGSGPLDTNDYIDLGDLD